jgi:acylphosphatase
VWLFKAGAKKMAEKGGLHCIVSGRVQGVWFRATTRDQAKELGLTGWVRNLPSGEVEVLACGSKESLKQLQQWLHQGPKMAKVETVEAKEVPWEEFSDFSVT